MTSLESPHLLLRDAGPEDLPVLLEVYLSNPAFVRLNEGSRGEPGYYDLEMFQRDWQVQRMMPGSHILCICDKVDGAIIGQASFLEENPEDGLPWLGLLMLHAKRQRQGLGTEAFACLAAHFRATYGWERLRLGVRRGNPAALAFWQRLGFRVVGEASGGGRDAYILERTLTNVGA
jgi:RimJ/RimL family protein N-acetyltransferase